MAKTKLISLRLDENLLCTVDDIAKKWKRNKRSQVINSILMNVIECSDDATLNDIIRTYDAYSSGYKVLFVQMKKS